LSQGEYVAPEKLENGLKMCVTVADIFIWGDSLQAYLVAIINCEPTNVTKMANEAGITGTWEEICANPAVKAMVAEDLKKQAALSGHKGFEQVRKFIIDPVTFQENHLVTESFKVKRNDAKIYYMDTINTMYA